MRCGTLRAGAPRVPACVRARRRRYFVWGDAVYIPLAWTGVGLLLGGIAMALRSPPPRAIDTTPMHRARDAAPRAPPPPPAPAAAEAAAAHAAGHVAVPAAAVSTAAPALFDTLATRDEGGLPVDPDIAATDAACVARCPTSPFD